MISLFVILLAICCSNASFLSANYKKYPLYIDVKPNINNNENFYTNLTDYANSPLVECINL